MCMIVVNIEAYGPVYMQLVYLSDEFHGTRPFYDAFGGVL